MQRILASCVRLPVLQENIPGSLMESVLSHVRGGDVLGTYDFVDVIDPKTRLGWQVKSTKVGTPVTWKRAKIPNAVELTEASYQSKDGLQALGNSIIKFCNNHARESLEKYELSEIGYSRLILRKNGQATYYERLLCSQDKPDIFEPSEFFWRWSKPKKTKGKEQLPALHGFHRETCAKWWAWHGRGENQLHFSGESTWWPGNNDPQMFTFQLPTQERKLSFENLLALMSFSDTQLPS